ncbi:MAG: glycosyltransferase, partial [Alphaproteobacteria bacterium]|nr:glycosyltransferase [Alphaproteobacteria bacterium]
MRILHVFRSPVGGLFRHVRDLAMAQAASGHDVGLLCDSATGGIHAVEILAELDSVCTLGVTREAMSKLPGLGDISCSRRTAELAKLLNIDVIHGHGAKGGLYGRLGAKLASKRAVYTPHGGSLHYQWNKGLGPL